MFKDAINYLQVYYRLIIYMNIVHAHLSNITNNLTQSSGSQLKKRGKAQKEIGGSNRNLFE